MPAMSFCISGRNFPSSDMSESLLTKYTVSSSWALAYSTAVSQIAASRAPVL